MQNPDKLRVFERSTVLAVDVYRLTSRFPSAEQFGLTAQMRRAAVSIGSNIAEGCGRRGNGELLQFLYIASGSARELTFQLRLAAEFDYGTPADRDLVHDHLDHVERMLNRLTDHLRTRPTGKRRRVSL